MEQHIDVWRVIVDVLGMILCIQMFLLTFRKK